MEAKYSADYPSNEPAPPPYSAYTESDQEVPSAAVPSVEAPRLSQTHQLPESRLSKPIAIPATSKQLGSAFLRAYPPILEHYHIPQDAFLDFLDKLNRLATPNPGVQLVGAAGGIVSMVPNHLTLAIGTGIQAGARLGTAATSKASVATFLKKANAEIFSSRKLTVQITRLEALARMTHMPILDSSGSLDKHSSLLAPVDELEDGSLAVTSAQERRLAALDQYIEHLELAPSDIKKPDGFMAKISQGASERNRKKQEKKMLKDREKTHKDYIKDSSKAEEDFQKEMSKLDKDADKVMRKEHDPKKIEEEMHKIEKDRQKVYQEYYKDLREVSDDQIKDDKEEEAMRKIHWLVIWNAGDDIV